LNESHSARNDEICKKIGIGKRRKKKLQDNGNNTGMAKLVFAD
jgi:hypothetical protein